MKRFLLALLFAPVFANSQSLSTLPPLEAPQYGLPEAPASPAPTMLGESLGAGASLSALPQSLPVESLSSLSAAPVGTPAASLSGAVPLEGLRGLAAAPEKGQGSEQAGRLGRYFDLSYEKAEPSRRDETVVDDYFGTKVADPYRWLEDDNSSETKAWVDMENRSSRSLLDQLPGRAEIKARLEALWNNERIGAPKKHGKWWYFHKNSGLQNQDVLYRARSPKGKAEVFFDPNSLSKDGTVALSATSFSKDGRYMAYSLSKAGSDWNDWKIRDVETGQDLAETIQWTKWSGASWTKDGKGFYYTRYPEPKPGEELSGSTENAMVYYHRLGEAQSSDTLIHQDPAHPKWGFSAWESSRGNRLFLVQHEGTESKNRLFVKDLRKPNAAFRPVFGDFDASYTIVGQEGAKLWVHTTKDAPRGRFILVDIDHPEPANWKEIISQSPGRAVLESVQFMGKKLVATWMTDAHSVIKVYAADGTYERDIPLPTIGSAEFYRPNKDNAKIGMVTFTSFTHPSSIYTYNVKTGKLRELRKPGLQFDPHQFETKQEFYPSKDGTMIPMFIVHKKGLKLDGQNPTYLYGYGGFNISKTPEFARSIIAWLEMGGVYALPNLRGGGEYGDEWHDAGRRHNKQNVFDDFIAAGEWLIANKYTSTPRLAIGGGSNGGLLVGASMTQRPDLFGAAIPEVGVLDMLRFHLFTIGHAWISDYLSSETKDGFDTLIKYSPLHNVRPGTAYPPTMVMTGDHDDRVVPAHSHKFTAALQAAQSGDAPIVSRIDKDAGHGAGKPLGKVLEAIADKWAFLKAMLRF
jgi:prolyl oligopeptidase